MRRRDFLGLAGCAAVWPLVTSAQQADRVRRIGAIITRSADDPEGQMMVGAFLQGLQELGWALGRNVRIDYRWGAVDQDTLHRYAKELNRLSPDVAVATGSSATRALKSESDTLPIVFVATGDPVAGGLVASLSQPGGNATGFLAIEYGMSAKWLELLKQIAPHVMQVGVLRDITTAGGLGEYGAIQAVAPSFRVELSPLDVRDSRAIQRSLSKFSRKSNGGLIVTTGRRARMHRNLIVELAARYKLPAVYPDRFFVSAGGLMSYGPDTVNQFRRAAIYVDRILKGEKTTDLPVQSPNKFELHINLKTAKALDLIVPAALISRADEVIE